MDLWKAYLLAGLIAHKLVWEILKRRAPAHAAPKAKDPLAWIAKGAKLLILFGLVAQTFLPDILPIAADAAPLRIAGASLFTLGLAVALAARIRLGEQWSDIEDAELRREHSLVNDGVYRFVRHPIYSGDLALLIGFELAVNSWLVLGALALIPIVVQRALREERVLARSLPRYADYRRRVKGFVPFVF